MVVSLTLYVGEFCSVDDGVQMLEDSVVGVDSVDELNAFYADMMFYGRKALDVARAKDVKGNRFVGWTSADRTFWIPGMGVLAEFLILGLSHHVGGKTYTYKSAQNLFQKMLSGARGFDKESLEALALGLGFSKNERDFFRDVMGGFRMPLHSNGDGNLPRGADREEIARLYLEMENRELRLEDAALFRSSSKADPERGVLNRLGPVKLAELLTAGRLTPDWEREYENSTSLYSGNIFVEDPIPALEAIAVHQRVMVLGDPGHGKSTVLRAAAEQALAAGGVVVVRARFEDLGEAGRASALRGASATEQNSLEWALGMLLEAAAASGLDTARIRDRSIEILRRSSAALVLIDGLDEISNVERNGFARKITSVLIGHRGADGVWEGGVAGRIVMASRVTGYKRPSEEIEEVLVPLLDDGFPEKFIRGWCGGRNPDGLARALDALQDGHLGDLARVPVIATFLAQIAEDEEPETTKHGLYRQYLEKFLSRTWKPDYKTLTSAKFGPVWILQLT